MNRTTLAILTAWIGVGLGLLPCRPALAETIERGQAATVPWSGYWWPLRQGGLVQPLEKYDQITGRQSVSWEHGNRRLGPDAPAWFGHCHAWAASAVMEREPVASHVAAAPQGQPVLLGIGDQKGWLAACHTRDAAHTYGQRTEEGQEPIGLAPEVLWRLLRLYVQQHQVPLILDIEPGPEVWNYPVFEYELVHCPEPEPGPDSDTDTNGNDDGTPHRATLTLLMSDSGVPPDHVGVKTRRHLYQFTFRMRGGSVVMGSGRWERPSREDHPEFAWYPLMAVADNPEVAYDLVRQVLWNTVAEGAPDAADDSVAEGVDSQPTPGGAALAEPDSPAPACDAQLSQTRNDAAQTDTPQTDTPEAGEAESETPPPAAGAAPSADEPAPKPVLLSPLELAAMVTDKTSSFGLDVTVDRFDGGHYRAGETFIVRGVSARGGHLYLLHLDSRGDLTLLYPLAGQSNRVRAETPFVVPGDGHRFAFRALPPPGVNRIRAVVTQQPLELTGLVSRVLPKEKGTDQSLQDARQIFRWHPAQQQQIRQLLKQDPQSQADPAAELGAFDPRRILGPFAHDEVAFYVDAADTEPDASARPPANEE